MIPSHLFFCDAIKLLIHWQLYYEKAHKDYEKFGISDSLMKRVIYWDLKIVCFFIVVINLNFEV